MNQYQHIFTQLFKIGPRRKGSECRLMLHLAGLAVECRNLEVEASETALMEGAKIGHSVLQRAKASLHADGLVRHIPGGRQRRDRFYLSFLNGVQLHLFTEQTAPILGAEGTPTLGAGAPRTGAEGTPTLGAGAPRTGAEGTPTLGAGAPRTGAENGGKPGTVRPEQAHQDGFPQQDVDIPRARIGSDQDPFVGSGLSSIDRVLRTTTIQDHDRPAADRLRSYLRSFAAKHGQPDMAGDVVPERIVAQCLAIRPAVELIEALPRIAAALGPQKFRTWGFFVTAFLELLEGAEPKVIAQRRAILRQQKPASKVTADPNFTSDLLQQGVHGVKSMR